LIAFSTTSCGRRSALPPPARPGTSRPPSTCAPTTTRSFTRSFSLPDGLDEQNLTAELADGVLTIAVPKQPKAKPRRIEIRGGSTARQLEGGEGGGNGKRGG
jgi:hypothetical protein